MQELEDFALVANLWNRGGLGLDAFFSDRRSSIPCE